MACAVTPGASFSVSSDRLPFHLLMPAVIFVVDAADPGRFQEAQAELESAAEPAHLQNKPLLVFANKQGKWMR